MPALNRILIIVPAVATLGCLQGPIAWGDPKEVPHAQYDSIYSIPGLKPPAPPDQCRGTVQMSVLLGGIYAAWWSVRPDSGADIVATSSRDGVTWTPPVRLDTVDVSRLGCRRPPPALFADHQRGNVYVVYAMRAPEGPGLFLSHSMDGARTFHSPVAIVYGERLGLASVAADSFNVIVAYEDPNSTPTRISIALSNTMGHLFDFREVVSSEDVAGSEPHVTVQGKDVTLQWRRASGDSTKRIERRGTLR